MTKKILLAITLLLFLHSVTAIENQQPLIKINFTEPINPETLDVNLKNLSNHDFPLELQNSSNDIVFYYMPKDPLPEGTYILRAQAEDLAGNIGNLFEYELTIRFKPLLITLVNPRFEYSANKTLDIVVNTTRDAQCRYFDAETVEDIFFDQMHPFSSTGTTIHTITDFTIAIDSQLLYVKCFDLTRKSYKSKLFKLWHDMQKPLITEIKLYPDHIFESSEPFTLYVTTDEDTLCKYSLNETNFPSMEYTFYGFDQSNFQKSHTESLKIPRLESGIYSYYVICIDKAGLISDYSYADLTVDLHRPFEIIEVTAPSYTNSTSVKITVKTNYNASCSIRNSFNYDLYTSYGDSKTHYRTISNLNTGTSVYNITCTRTVTQEKAYDSITITVDDTPPKMIYVREIGYGNESGKTYKTNNLKGEWKAEDNESGVTQYNILLYLDNEFSEDELIHSLTTPDTEEEITGLELNDYEKYYFKVSAVNNVDLWSNTKTGDGITVDTSLALSSCNNGKKDSNEAGVDCGGACSKGCPINSSCSENSDCKSGFCRESICTESTCDDDLKGPNEADVDCGGVCDEKCKVGKNCGDDDDCKSGNCDISTGKCIEAGKCYNKKLDPGETDVDCGGVCLVKCDNGDICESNYDCKSGNCLDNSCFEPTCSDGMQNQDETDTDCGGSCSPCENDKSCLKDDDCLSENCENNICAELITITDKDNDGLSNEWEDKYNEGDLDPDLYDTDGDGIPDADEDFDNDGLTNSVEAKYGTNPHKKDTDGDGYTDKEEIDKATNPLDIDDYPKSNALFYIFLFIALILLGVGAFFLVKKYKEMREGKIEIPPIEEKPVEIKPIAQPKPEQKAPPKKPRIIKKITPPGLKEKLMKAREKKIKKRRRIFDKFGFGGPFIKEEAKPKEEIKPKEIEEEGPKVGWVELKVPKKPEEKPKKKISSIFEKLPKIPSTKSMGKIPSEGVFAVLSKMVGAEVKETTVKEFTDIAEKKKLTKEELIELISKFSKEKKLDEETLHKILVSILEEKKSPIKKEKKEKLPTIVKKEVKKRKKKI